MDNNERKIYSAFSKMWANSGKRYLDILRYTITGANPQSGVEGTATLTAGLANLRCVVFRDRDSDLLTAKGIISDMRRKIVFYAPPDYTPTLDDKISLGGLDWDIVRIDGSALTSGYQSFLIRRNA